MVDERRGYKKIHQCTHNSSIWRAATPETGGWPCLGAKSMAPNQIKGHKPYKYTIPVTTCEKTKITKPYQSKVSGS